MQVFKFEVSSFKFQVSGFRFASRVELLWLGLACRLTDVAKSLRLCRRCLLVGVIALADIHHLPVPQWQREVLDDRETKGAEGTARDIDWEILERETLVAVK